MYLFRGDFRQRFEHEDTFMHAGMGDLKVSAGYNQIFVEEDIEIDHAGPPAVRVYPPHICFYFLKERKEPRGREVRLDLYCHINEAGLIFRPPGLGFVQRGLFKYGLSSLPEEADGLKTAGPPVSDVGTYTYIRLRHKGPGKSEGLAYSPDGFSYPFGGNGEREPDVSFAGGSEAVARRREHSRFVQ